MKEPDWNEGCLAYGRKPGEECPDCIHQRGHFGYVLENGEWIKK